MTARKATDLNRLNPFNPWPIHSASANNYFADLNHGRKIRVVRNVAHDFLRMRSEAILKCLDGIAKNVAHADVGGRSTWSTACQPFVHRVMFAAFAHSGLHQGHVLIAIVLMVESSSRSVRVHHSDLDH